LQERKTRILLRGLSDANQAGEDEQAAEEFVWHVLTFCLAVATTAPFDSF